MKFEQKLIEGVLLKRYKRFFADVELVIDGKTQVHVAHVPNTGSLKGCLEPGQRCLVEPASNPERKLRWTLQALQSGSGKNWVGVNTANPGKLLQEGFANQKISGWKKFKFIKPEIKISKETRLDFLLCETEPTEKQIKTLDFKSARFVEVKNVTMANQIGKNLVAQFPDSVTERGLKHLHELIELKEKGFDAEILFFVQRTDCDYFAGAEQIDPEYVKALRLAQKSGVIITALESQLSKQKIELTGRELEVRV